MVKQNPITRGTRHGKRHLPITKAYIQIAKTDKDWEERTTAM